MTPNEFIRAEVEEMADIESSVLRILSGYKSHPQKTPEYSITDSDTMLGWKSPTEIQRLPGSMWRVGAIGDGNCMIHSILFAASPSYQLENNTYRAHIAKQIRHELNSRITELKAIADILYSDIGGAMALDESFEILTAHISSELNLEMGPVICRLYGLNFLGIKVVENTIKPLIATYTDGRYNPDLPSIIVNYRAGRATNIGEKDAAKPMIGHYESIVLGDVMPKSKSISTFVPATTYMFHPGDHQLTPLLTAFERLKQAMGEEALALRIQVRNATPPLSRPTIHISSGSRSRSSTRKRSTASSGRSRKRSSSKR